MEPFEEDGIAKIRFEIHPLQKQTGIVLACQAPIADRRMVSDSGGYKEMRYVINTILVLGTVRTRVEMTLTGRGYRVVSDAPGAECHSWYLLR